MTISYYIHAWQGLLMFIAGTISVLASFAGYLNSGGGEELLRRALVKMKTGAAQFDSIKFNWLAGEMVVSKLSHKDFTWGDGAESARFSGIQADLVVKLDLYPWPPEVERIIVKNMENTAITVTDGFLQSGKLPRPQPDLKLPIIEFKNCNLNLRMGEKPPLQLSGCNGELRLGGTGGLRGAFSLSKLNDKPFNFRLETLEDDRWVLTGNNIQIDTRDALAAASNPLAGKLDIVGLLVSGLFSGELGAHGKLDSLRIVVQPSTSHNKFSCDGEVGYSRMEFQLPKPGQQAEQAVPVLLDMLLWSGKNLWPRWMQVDRIITGVNGRVAFHMSDGKLDFACDEGAGSAFTGTRQGQVFPPLESLKGSVETDDDGQPRRILLRGFLGDQLSFETHVDKQSDGSRVYELLLEPRAGDTRRIVFGKPLWRFASRVQDFIDMKKVAGSDEIDHPLVAFEMETDARHFPWKEWLPPGIRDVSGHMYAKGSFTESFRLRLENITLDDHSSLSYGGVPQDANAQKSDFGPLWLALQSFFGTGTPWKLQDVTLQGRAEVQFSPELRWETTVLKDFTLTSGSIEYAGLGSEIGLAGIKLSALHKRLDTKSEIDITATVPDLWQVKLSGDWKQDAGKPALGGFKLIEKDVPLKLHPLREKLNPEYISPDKRRVNRTTLVRINDSKVESEVQP